MFTSRPLAALFACALAAAGPGFAGEVGGRVALGVDGASLDGAGPIVVYLEGIDSAIALPASERTFRIQQKNASFSPSFLAIAAGEQVVMPNDDVIFHNVFSYSTPNDFDLGLYPKGTSRAKTFQYPGVVRIYCSIHESMNATIFVSPSRLYAIAEPDGAFAIRDVPPGRYRVRTWNRRLPPATQIVEVGADAPAVARLVVAAEAPR